MNFKFCKDCKHIQRQTLKELFETALFGRNWVTRRCGHELSRFYDTHVVSGMSDEQYHDCETMRRTFVCGPEGKLYEPK